MRRRIKLFSDLLGPIWAAAIVVITILGRLRTILGLFPQTQSFVENLGTNEPLALILSLFHEYWLIVVLFVVIIVLFEGAYRRLSVYYWEEPNLRLSTHDDRNEYRGQATIRYALLAIENREELEVTDCFATFEKVAYIDEDLEIPVREARGRLIWEQTNNSNADCETTVRPKSTDARVQVALFNGRPHFRTCKPDPSHRQSANQLGVYVITIRVDGKFKGRAMKPQFFNGYLYAMNLLNNEGRTETTFLFREGEWIKDKQIPNWMKVKQTSKLGTAKEQVDGH